MPSAIEVSIVGPGAFRGRESSLTSYSVDEAITPLDGTAASPGVGTITFGAVEHEDTIFLMDNEIELRDGARGKARGTVRAITTGDAALTVTSDSILSFMNATKLADAYQGTLGAAIAYYLSLVNITDGFEIQDDIAARPVKLIGWRDNVLTMMSDLCVAQQIEMSVVYDNIVFRTPRQNQAVTKRDSSRGLSLDRGSPAKTIDGYWYETKLIEDQIIYPTPLEDPRMGFQVDVNESLEPTRIQLSSTPTHVNQPQPTEFLAPDYKVTGGFLGTAGAYVVLGMDDLPIPAVEWIAKGGKVEVSIDPTTPEYLIINVHGMNQPNDPRAPYRVGVMSSGDSTYYSAFYVTGSGVAFEKKHLVISTGATNTETDLGATIDNKAITSMEQLATAMQKGVYRFSGINYSLTATASSITRAQAGDEFATSKMAAFDTLFAGQKMSALDAQDWTFAAFDSYFAGLVIDQFQNQLYGNAAGARVYRDGIYLRVNTASTSQDSSNYSATIDTLWSDFDMVWAGKKFSAWNTAWSGHKLRDWDLRPLRGA